MEFVIGSSNQKGVLSSNLNKYPSIVEIHKNINLQPTSISIPFSSWGSTITPTQIKTILKSLNSKKGPGIDKTPTEIVKLAPSVLAEPLPIAISNSVSTSTFPNNATITSVVPVGKKKDDKYVISQRIERITIRSMSC